MYDAQIVSTYPVAVTGRAWTDLILPNGNQYGPLINIPITVAPGTMFFGNLVQNIPAYAPSGNYTFNAYLGQYPNFVATSDSFPFVKTIVPGPDGEITSDWEAGEWEIAGQDADVVSSAVTPDQFTLHPVWPNPFNASATVTIDLPEASELLVRVFSLDGREVAVLAQGHMPAGTHNLHFDGEGLASGIYFLQATVGNNQSVVRKVTLLK
ncbi:hypothetical protein BMS3Bbin04_00916 [bacterium BMS3Bbin04]|nr:hypothetical protein BMS3Bbin04_00916 [bacterium BMS3Bbin04]